MSCWGLVGLLNSKFRCIKTTLSTTIGSPQKCRLHSDHQLPAELRMGQLLKGGTHQELNSTLEPHLDMVKGWKIPTYLALSEI